jgi:hypothetical protein
VGLEPTHSLPKIEGTVRAKGEAVDPFGAASLSWRIEQHTHWQQAKAVRDGRQPATDPERDDVEAIADGIRLYTTRTVGGESIQPCKRLIEGVWVNGVANSDETEIADIRRDELLRNDGAHGLGQLHV